VKHLVDLLVEDGGWIRFVDWHFSSSTISAKLSTELKVRSNLQKKRRARSADYISNKPHLSYGGPAILTRADLAVERSILVRDDEWRLGRGGIGGEDDEGDTCLISSFP
jgi:hypothetical protein